MYVRNSNQAYEANEKDAEQRSRTLCSFGHLIVVQPCHFSVRCLSLTYFDAGSALFNNHPLPKVQEEYVCRSLRSPDDPTG